MERAKRQIDDTYNRNFGSMFRSGSRQTFFAKQARRYADLYACTKQTHLSPTHSLTHNYCCCSDHLLYPQLPFLLSVPLRRVASRTRRPHCAGRRHLSRRDSLKKEFIFLRVHTHTHHTLYHFALFLPSPLRRPRPRSPTTRIKFLN